MSALAIAAGALETVVSGTLRTDRAAIRRFDYEVLNLA
jgi:hypothetical protein